MILAIDTSCDRASCAIVQNDIIIGEKFVHNKKKHAETLLPMIGELLNENKIKADDISLYAVSQGPGSFTGLRIGIATIKAMAYAMKRKVVSVPTLDILANMYEKSSSLVVPMIDARNEQIYTSLYAWGKDRYEPIEDYMGVHISELKDILKKHQKNALLCGDGGIKYHGYLEAKKPNEDMVYPKASVCGLLAKSGKQVDPDEVLPFYLRPSQAERLFGK